MTTKMLTFPSLILLPLDHIIVGLRLRSHLLPLPMLEFIWTGQHRLPLPLVPLRKGRVSLADQLLRCMARELAYGALGVMTQLLEGS